MSASSAELVELARSRVEHHDLGPDGWQDGLDRLLDAAAHDLRDDPAAMARIENTIVDRLTTRLRIEQWYTDHAAEPGHPVEGPLFIVGLPRTATTALNHLLAIEPQLRPLRSWEVNDPVPPPDVATEHADPRRSSAALAPDVRHITTIDGPAEDWPIHALAFDHAELALPVPSNTRWWRERDHGTLMPYHERVLRLLHSHRPPTRWLLKSPAYLFLLDETAAHYPGARFVFTHRDPVAAFASTCSTIADSRRKRTPTWSPGQSFGPELLEHWAAGMARAVTARAAIGEHRFVDVAQRDLEADPGGTAERVLRLAGLELSHSTRQSMDEWAAANRRGVRGEHRYNLADHGLSVGQVAEAFDGYLRRFAELCPRDAERD